MDRYVVAFLVVLARFLIAPASRFHPFILLLILSLLYPSVPTSWFVVGRIIFLLTLFAGVR